MRDSPVQRAQVLIEMRRYAEAEQYLRSGLQAEPADGYANALLARCLQRQGRILDAVKQAKHAIGVDPSLGFAHAISAEVHIQANLLPLAQAAIREALRIEPKNASYLCVAAAIQANFGNAKEARLIVERAIAIDPDRADSKRLYALTLDLTGSQQKALEVSSDAAANYPMDSAVLVQHGNIMLGLGQWTEASDAFQAALRIEPASDGARAGLAEALKCRFAPYRALFRIWHWAQLSSARRTAVAIAAIAELTLGLIAAGALATSKPSISAGIVALTFLVFFCVIYRPVSNILIVFHPQGRVLLARWQRNLCLTMLALITITIVGFIAAFPQGANPIYGGGFVICLVLTGLVGQYTVPPKPK